MKVFLRKDIERVGLAGEIIKVSDGYATNFLLPKNFAVEVTPQNEAQFAKRAMVVENRKEVVESKTSMLAEKVKALSVTLKKKLHDDDKLYGAVSQGEVADLLADKGLKIPKNQIVFDKSIKEKGSYKVTVKLSSKLQPKFTLKVVGE